jgi:hypothetical protein
MTRLLTSTARASSDVVPHRTIRRELARSGRKDDMRYAIGSRSSDQSTRSFIRNLTHDLTIRLEARARRVHLQNHVVDGDGVPVEELPGIRWEVVQDSGRAVHADVRANHYLGSRAARSSTIMQRLHGSLKARRYLEFRVELALAEATGQLSEFHVLNFHAILAVVERSEFAGDYLEMAEAVAAMPYERAVVAENRAAHELLEGNPLAAAERCLATLDGVGQTEGLWINLLIALYRLGETETIDATLRGFMRLDDECTARLVGLLSSDPDLHDVRARPAFRQLIDSRERVVG